MTRYHRELLRVLAGAGLNDVRILHTHKHLKIVCAEGRLTVAATPSDRRNLLNIRAAAKRLVVG